MHTSRLTAFGLLLASCVLPNLANAQQPGDGSWDSPPEAPAAPAPAAPPSAPAGTPAPVTAAAAPAAPAAATAPAATPAPLTNCRVNPSIAIDRATGLTIGGLVCDSLRSKVSGVGALSEGSQPGLPGYDVSIQRLGHKIILKLQRTNAAGQVDRTETLTLTGVEEATEAAPRLASAMSDEVDIKDTERVDNLVGEETRRYKKKSGESMFGLGIGAQMAGSSFAGSTLHLSYQYETPSFGLLARGSVGGLGDNQDEDWMYSYLSVGGRYFFNSENISPLIGGGLSISSMSHENYATNDTYNYEGNGGGAYIEVGVEALRLHKTRLELSLRVDLPFYSLKDQRSDYYYGADQPEPRDGSKYVAPVSLNATIHF